MSDLDSISTFNAHGIVFYDLLSGKRTCDWYNTIYELRHAIHIVLAFHRVSVRACLALVFFGSVGYTMSFECFLMVKISRHDAMVDGIPHQSSVSRMLA